MEFFIGDYKSQLVDTGVVAFAALLAGCIGIEREHSGKPAGFRTHMLVGGASALLVLLSGYIVQTRIDNPDMAGVVRSDPIRVIEAIIVGIGFIGAGTILKLEAARRVRFLTTAGSILFAAGIGIAVALHQFLLAVLLVIVVLIVNVLFGKVGDHVGGSPENPE